MKNVILTQEMIGDLQTEYGGFTRATLKALGIAWPPLHGWRRDLIGSAITEAAYEAAMAGKGIISRATAKGRVKRLTKANAKASLVKAYATHDQLTAAFEAVMFRTK